MAALVCWLASREASFSTAAVFDCTAAVPPTDGTDAPHLAQRNADLRFPHAFVDLSRQYYAWLQDDPLPNNPAGNIAPLAHKSYLPVDYLSHTAGYAVLGTVHVECGLGHDASLAETIGSKAWPTTPAFHRPSWLAHSWNIKMRRGYWKPMPSARAYAASGKLSTGIRTKTKTYTAADLLANSAWQRGFARLEPLGLAFDLQAYPLQLPDAARLAARNPRTTIVLNHAGMPTDRAATGIQAWDSGMALLAEQPNVRVKISGLGMVDRAWTEASIRPFILPHDRSVRPGALHVRQQLSRGQHPRRVRYALRGVRPHHCRVHRPRAPRPFRRTARDTYRLAFDLPPETIYEART